MRNIFKKGLFIAIACLMTGAVWAQTGTYSTRVISSDGTTSTWTFILPSSQVTIPANTETEDNDIIYAPSGSSKMKFSSSNQFSWQGQSSGYIPVPAGGAGTISMTVKGSSDSRYLQLYVNGTAAENTKRLYSKASSDGNVSSDGKKGPQSFTFTASDLTTKGGKTYLHFKDNNTEMKIASFTVTLTSGSYSGGSGGGGDDPVAVTGVSLNKTSTSIAAGQTEQLTATVAPSNATDKTVSWQTSNPSAATVSSTGLVTGVAAGTATITVTTTDGGKTATCAVTVTSGGDPTPVVPTPVPSSDLTIHQPEVYEAPTTAGGYNTPLVVFGSREYEVYYINRDNSSNVTIATSNVDKMGNICDDTHASSNTCLAKDGWARISSNGTGGDSNASAKDEFQTSTRCLKLNNSNHALEIHIQGYDQFSFYGNDNNTNASKGKMFEVYIDGVKQTRTPSSYAVNRFPLVSGEHLIRVSAIGGSDSKLCSFSLRVAQEPRTKYLEGNDTTQVIYQTQEPLPVYYYTKYSRIANARTELEWTGGTAAGITLQNAGQDELGDTITIAGLANCQTGVYHYDVVNYYNNVETSRVSGSFKVATYLRSLSRDSVFEAYTNEPMDEISFKYIALSPDSVHLTWKDNKAPAGVSGKSNTEQSKYSIGGTPTKAGTYDFTVSIGGGNSISGRLEIKSLDLGSNPIIYLYKNSLAYENDGVYKYLTSSAGGSLNLITRKASENGPRDSYSKYKWILISEDVDADNPEVLAIIRDNAAGLPVLNMKGFTYATGRLGWGEPDNGTMDTVSKNGCNIFVMQPEHPIFSGINFDRATGMLKVLEKADKRGIMPINVTKQGSLCLATGYTRDIEDYYKDGELQTVIHEVPVGGGRNKNYICFPLSNTKDNLTAQGKALLKNIVNYITGTQHFSTLPELEMTSFSVAGYTAHINQSENLIELEMTKEQFEEADSLRAAKPIITVKDSKTHAIPASNEEVDLRYTTFLPKTFVVTDYINRRAYSFKLTVTRPQGIDEVYTVGEWVNIFDIYGRKITTTNEDIYTMDLPHGIYLVVTGNGNTIKIMK